MRKRIESFSVLLRNSLLELVSSKIVHRCPSRILAQALAYTLENPGKCVRSFLASASAQVFGADLEKTLPLCVAIEVMHTYSLVHDDLPSMDDAPIRRKKNSCHKEFGEAIALLTGDALLTLTFELLSSMEEEYSTRCRIIELISRACGHSGMVGGQVMDIAELEFSESKDTAICIMHQSKTAMLFSASCEAGAILGGAGPEEVKILSEYGMTLGQVFQANDDLKDAQEDKAHSNMACIWGVEKTTTYINEMLCKCKSHLEKLDRDVTILKEFIAFMEDSVTWGR